MKEKDTVEGLRVVFDTPEMFRDYVRRQTGRAVLKAWRMGFLAGWVGAAVLAGAVACLYWWLP